MAWEYLVIDLTEHVRGRQLVPDEVQLNRAGAAGWELVGVPIGGKAYFKRPVPQVKPKTSPRAPAR